MPDSVPITVAILTYQRQEELLETLRAVKRQSYSRLETVVVNNHDDDTANVVQSQFEDVKVLSLTENLGCAARNTAVQTANSDIVVTIDNDVHLSGDDFIQKLVAFFDQTPAAACVTFKVLDPEGGLSERDWCHRRDPSRWTNESFRTDHISEGACAFRKDMFLQAEGYWRELFIGQEGPELNLRLLKCGYETWYCPDLQVVHHASPQARPSHRSHYFNTRNNLLLAYRHFPFHLLVPHVSVYAGMTLYYALKERRLGAYLRGIRDATTMAWSEPRRPLDRCQREYLLRIWQHKPSLWSRIAKHLAMPKPYR